MSSLTRYGVPRPGSGALRPSRSVVAAVDPAVVSSSTVTMAGTSGLSVSGLQEIQPSVTMAGTSGLSVSGTQQVPSAITLAGTSGLSVAGRQDVPAAATIAGTSGLSVTGARQDVPSGAVTLAGTSGLAVTPDVQRVAAITLAGTGGLAVTPALQRVASVTIAGVGTLSVTGSLKQISTSVGLVGVGGLLVGPKPWTPISEVSTQFTGTSGSVPIPAYTVGDTIVYARSSNQAATALGATGLTGTFTEHETNGGDRRGEFFSIKPSTAGQTSFTLNVTGTSGVNTLYGFNVGPNRDFAAAIPLAHVSTGNSTAPGVVSPKLDLGFIATGYELLLVLWGVNSTASWTQHAETIFATTSGNAALMVDALPATFDAITGMFALTGDRGNSGSTRNQNAVAIALQSTSPQGPVHYTVNGSMENYPATPGLPIGWNEEHTTVNVPVYSRVAGTDGQYAIQIAYTGVPGDVNAIIELYADPIAAVPAEQWSAALDVGGTSTVGGVVGLEAFRTGPVYIDETDTNVPAPAGSVIRYTVSHTMPALTVQHVPFLQLQGINNGDVILVTLDRVPTTKGAVPVSSAVTMAGTSGLSVAGTQQIPNAITLAGTGGLVITGRQDVPAAITLAGTGGLAVSGRQDVASAVTLVGTSSLSVTPAQQIPAAVTIAGTSTLAIAGRQDIPAAIALAGTSALAVTPAVQRVGVVTLAGVGALSVTGRQDIPAVITIAGVGDLIVSVSGSQTAAVTLAGTSSLSVSGLKQVPVSITLAGTSALSVTATVQRVAGAIVIAGVGGLVVGGIKQIPSVVTFVGVGQLSVVASVPSVGANIVFHAVLAPQTHRYRATLGERRYVATMGNRRYAATLGEQL